MSPAGTGRPRVVLLRGHNVNAWDLRPFEPLAGRYEFEVLLTGSNLHRVDGLGMRQVPTPSPRDWLPGPGLVSGGAAYVLGERYLGLEQRLTGASLVHAAEIGSWFSAQAADLKAKLGFKLVLTVWETLPFGTALRWPRERRYRRSVLPAADLLLAATERARDGLLLEGVDPARIVVCPPGIDTDHFSARDGAAASAEGHTLLTAGRLVWEKGHHDVLRALAALRNGIGGPARPDVRLLVVGSGPEEAKLKGHARDLGLGGHVEFRPTVPYAEMPALYRQASALVLGSVPVRGWEEQFGMVLAEAMATGTPIVATDTGAIPEVLGDQAPLVPAGDWRGIAAALRAGPLQDPPATRRTYDPDGVRHFSSAAASDRLAAAYDAALAL